MAYLPRSGHLKTFGGNCRAALGSQYCQLRFSERSFGAAPSFSNSQSVTLAEILKSKSVNKLKAIAAQALSDLSAATALLEEVRDSKKKSEELLGEVRDNLGKQLLHKDAEIMRLKGTFTARGVLEHAAKQAHYELQTDTKGLNIISKNSRFVATHILRDVQGNGEKLGKHPDHYLWCNYLLRAVETCAKLHAGSHPPLLADLYEELSEPIHQARWSGEAVLLSDRVPEPSRCVIETLAEQARWRCEIQGITEGSRPDATN